MSEETDPEWRMAREQSGSERDVAAERGASASEGAAFAESSFSREDSKGQVVHFQVPPPSNQQSIKPASFLAKWTPASLGEGRTKQGREIWQGKLRIFFFLQGTAQDPSGSLSAEMQFP